MEGIVGLARPVPIDDAGVTVVAPIAAAVVSLLALVAMRTQHTVTRREGLLLIVAYAATVPFLA